MLIYFRIFIFTHKYDIILRLMKKVKIKEKTMSILKTLLFASVVATSYFIEGIIGFGGTIIAIPLASGIAGIKLTVPVLTLVVFFASIVIALRDFKHIDKREFIKITLLMVIGLPIGMYLFKHLPERPLKLFLSIFMIVIAIKGLVKGLKDKNNKDIEKPTVKGKGWISNLSIFVGGIVHGAFTCGGPFVVVYATNNIKDKSAFRATLCALWAILNGIMLIINFIAGDITREVLTLSLWTMPLVVLAIIISNIVHKKLEGQNFTNFVYLALFVSGVLMAL